MIAHVDKRFGDLEEFLIEHKLRDNTIVIFMTDNGGTAGVNVFNAGLRAGKTTYYDGGHRVPCWVRWPERTRAALGDKYEPSPASPSNKPNVQTVGFPAIARAKIEIAGVRAEKTAVSTETAATIRVSVSAGTTILKAWFADADGNALCGAFFVSVRKVR